MKQLFELQGLDLAFVAGGTSVLLAYHLALSLLVSACPQLTVIGVTRKARVWWVETLIDKQTPIIAVQTLRNWIMQASLLATSASVVSIGLVTFMASNPEEPEPDEVEGEAVNNPIDGLFRTKLVFAILLLCASFFWFSQAIRIFNHVCLLIAVAVNRPSDEEEAETPQPPSSSSQQQHHHDTPLDEGTDTDSISSATGIAIICCDNPNPKPKPPVSTQNVSSELVANLLNKGSLFNAIGMRCFYLVFPVIFWLFGHVYFLGSALGLTLILINLDLISSNAVPNAFSMSS